jgi:hypothetical protein
MGDRREPVAPHYAMRRPTPPSTNEIGVKVLAEPAVERDAEAMLGRPMISGGSRSATDALRTQPARAAMCRSGTVRASPAPMDRCSTRQGRSIHGAADRAWKDTSWSEPCSAGTMSVPYPAGARQNRAHEIDRTSADLIGRFASRSHGRGGRSGGFRPPGERSVRLPPRDTDPAAAVFHKSEDPLGSRSIGSRPEVREEHADAALSDLTVESPIPAVTTKGTPAARYSPTFVGEAAISEKPGLVETDREATPARYRPT